MAVDCYVGLMLKFSHNSFKALHINDKDYDRCIRVYLYVSCEQRT